MRSICSRRRGGVGVLPAILFTWILAGLLVSCGDRVEPADLVLTNGNIVTMDEDLPRAAALAVRGQWIEALGSSRHIRRFIGPDTEVLDLEGRLVTPGFIEGHGHFLSLGRARQMLDLTEAATWDEVVAMVAQAVQEAERDEWILGRGWHQDKWDPQPRNLVDGVPLHDDLSRVSPRNPVHLTHASGHASIANARAMAMAGITRATRDPPGGQIVKDARGRPTGLLRETAQRLVSEVHAISLKARSDEEAEADFLDQVALAGADALAKGVTSFHDAGASFAEIDRFRELAEQGKLPVRLYVMVRRETNEDMARLLPDYRVIGAGDHFLTVRSIKRQVDGALGAHGAWLLEPYHDLPTSTGLVLEDLDDIRQTALLAIRHGFQLSTHAIGDRANREILDLYQEVFREHPDQTDLRWRVEHAQHLQLSDVPRFAELGVVAAMQGIHATSDLGWVPRRLGWDRTLTTSYLWRSLLDSGAVVGNGTDAPVEDIDPIQCFYASVTRRLEDGSVIRPDQRMTREEALYSYTMANAYAAFQEDIKGSLAPGKLADFVVLSRDIMSVSAEEIPAAEVVYTFLGGRLVYDGETRTAITRQATPWSAK